MLKHEDAASLVSTTRWSTLWQLIGSSLVLWDHATTLDQEIEFIWLRKWSITTLLYVVTRYAGDAAFMRVLAPFYENSNSCLDFLQVCRIQCMGFREVLGEDVRSECGTNQIPKLTFRIDSLIIRCPNAIQVQSWLTHIAMLAMDGIVVKRVVCMYSGDKRVVSALALAFAALILHSGTVTILTSHTRSAVERIQSVYSYEACNPLPLDSTPSWYWTWIISAIAFESLVFVLSLLQGISFVCENRHIRRDGRKVGVFEHLWRTRRTLASVLIRDSILFPSLNLLFGILTVLLWTGKLPISWTDWVNFAATASVPVLGVQAVVKSSQRILPTVSGRISPIAVRGRDVGLSRLVCRVCQPQDH
ncbi:hypothetical protein BKA70DRAFT_1505798 [Coprinopsis sp. MPI-PUGE-AT-0042]|nr:hypothetical protein BKA70DRAFT_1505798 [Coprinopsis sp. MPI-PUGE-AT-0042]